MMTEVKRTRTKREPLPLSALKVVDAIPAAEVPEVRGVRSTSTRRKWQDIAEHILAESSQGNWLVVTLEAGYDPDVVRSGLKEELKRTKHKLEWRLEHTEQKVLVMYFFARKVEE